MLITCYVNSGLNNVHKFVIAQSGRYYYTQVLCLPVKDEFYDQTRVTTANTTVSYAYQVIHRDKHYIHCVHIKHYTISTCSSRTTSDVTKTTHMLRNGSANQHKQICQDRGRNKLEYWNMEFFGAAAATLNMIT